MKGALNDARRRRPRGFSTPPTGTAADKREALLAAVRASGAQLMSLQKAPQKKTSEEGQQRVGGLVWPWAAQMCCPGVLLLREAVFLWQVQRYMFWTCLDDVNP